MASCVASSVLRRDENGESDRLCQKHAEARGSLLQPEPHDAQRLNGANNADYSTIASNMNHRTVVLAEAGGGDPATGTDGRSLSLL